jgi:hypothetical protein
MGFTGDHSRKGVVALFAHLNAIVTKLRSLIEEE